MSRKPPLHLLFWAACQGEVPDPDPLTCAEGELLDGESCVPEECGTGTWGDLQTDQDTLYVDGSAQTGGDGSQQSPFTVIQDALDAQGKDGMVAVAAGTYVENLQLTSEHTRVHLAGRCSELVTVDGSEGSGDDWADGIGLVVERTGLSAMWTVSGLTLTGAPSAGVGMNDGMLTLDRVSVVDNDHYGLEIYFGTVEATDCEVTGNGLVGVFESDASVTLQGVRITDTRPDSGGELGRAISVQEGATLQATECILQDNRQVAVYVGDASADLVDVQVLDTWPMEDGTGGEGITVVSDSTLLATDCLLQGNHQEGMVISDSTAILERVRVLDTEPSAIDAGGWGVLVVDDGALDATDCEVSGNQGVGIHVDGASASLENVAILDTRVDSTGQYGRGLQVQFDAQVTSSDCTVQDNGSFGMYVTEDSTLDVVDTVLQDNHGAGLIIANGALASLQGVQVLDTLPDASDSFGLGIMVLQATLEATDSVFQRNRQAGIYAGGSVVTLDSVQVLDTYRGTDITGALGIAPQYLEGQSSVVATNLTVQGTEGPGLYVVKSTMDCTGCVLADNAFAGAAAQAGGELVLTDSRIEGTIPDANSGGGLGIFVGDVGSSVEG
ncbi:MAG: right-handed parallel beta-helix repeat-containing protein, partial [Myxococcota bacterium]|nr:right-handed parallel beta-helix repeat-containing protein [Myxococcota bacterium]